MNANSILLFVHGAGGKPRTLQAGPDEKLGAALQRAGIQDLQGLHVFVGECATSLQHFTDEDDGADDQEAVALDHPVRTFGHGPHHIHCHRCRRIATTVNYQQLSKKHRFSPATTVATVLAWVRRKFKLTDADADKLVLQRCESTDRPRTNEHLGELAHAPACSLCFDLVFEQKVEG